MRVDQIITLVWAGNVALLGGTGWVGWTFWQQKQAQREIPKIAWPETEETVIGARWPGAVGGFKHIWDTPLNGLVPPPPPPPEAGPKAPKDIGAEFKARIQIDKAMLSPDKRATILVVMDGGQAKQITLGSSIDEWQLVDVAIDLEGGVATATFRNPRYEKDGGELVIRQDVPSLKPILATGPAPVVRELPEGIREAATMLPDDPQAWVDKTTGEWMVPEAEANYWQGGGQKDVLSQTKFVSRPGGLEIASQPPRGSLNGTRGFNQGDVIVSVNDVAVKSLDDVYRYFRGEGRGLRRYVFVIERDGARRTQTYNIVRKR